MNLAAVCWYLCGLFGLAAMAGSAMTVVPTLRQAQDIALAAMIAGTVVFGLLAIVLQRGKFEEPRWLLRVARIAAVLATGCILFGVIG